MLNIPAEVISQINRLPPAQQAQVIDQIKITQAKQSGRQRALDQLDSFIDTRNVANYVGIGSTGNIK